jgi:hypothetical protein
VADATAEVACVCRRFASDFLSFFPFVIRAKRRLPMLPPALACYGFARSTEWNR